MKKVLLNLISVFIFSLIFTLPSYAIRVGLEIDVKQSYLGSSTPSVIIDGQTKNKLYKIQKMKSYPIKAHKNNIAIKINNKWYDLGSNFIILKPEDKSAFVAAKNKWYRGELIVYAYNKI